LNSFSFIKKEDGFTIQEILVVLLVGSILIGLSLSLFLFTNRLFTTWSGTNNLKNEANRILYNIALDIQKSREISEHTDTSFVLLRNNGRYIRYIYNDKNLYRNEVDMTPNKAAIKLKIADDYNIGERLDRIPLFHISILVQSPLLDYSASMDAAPAPCSRLLFMQSRIHH
jgi:hypothetical protein